MAPKRRSKAARHGRSGKVRTLTGAVAKRKAEDYSSYLDLTEIMNCVDSTRVRDELIQLLHLNQTLHPSTRCIIESIKHLLPLAVGAQALNLQASKLNLGECTRLLGIDFELDQAHRWVLKNEQKPTKSLSNWAATAIQNIRESKYMRAFRPESTVRTIFDILICDRLEALDDTFAARHLKVAAEVQMAVPTKNDKKITGRADWTLGYMDEKERLHEMLVIIEAKARGQLANAIPQLLAYLTAVQEARTNPGKGNSTVFGLITDSDMFQFMVLKEGRQAFISKAIDWIDDRDLVVSFLDHILCDAIDASPHTTPMRTRNRKIKRFEESLDSTYSFGTEKGVYTDKNGLAWNVVEINGVSLLQPCGDLDNEILGQNTQILVLPPLSS